MASDNPEGSQSADILEESSNDGMTAADMYKLLIQAWCNEKCCPDLLKNKNDLVDCMMDQLKQMEQNLKTLSPDSFLQVPHRMEMDRIRYVISSYLRTRLKKIEAYTVFLLKRDRAIPNKDDRYMSSSEFQFAESYLENLKSHFQGEAFRYMPSLLHEFGGVGNVEVKPDMKSTVVFKVIKPIEGVLINGTPESLAVDTYHLVPYNDVKKLIEDGSGMCI